MRDGWGSRHVPYNRAHVLKLWPAIPKPQWPAIPKQLKGLLGSSLIAHARVQGPVPDNPQGLNGTSPTTEIEGVMARPQQPNGGRPYRNHKGSMGTSLTARVAGSLPLPPCQLPARRPSRERLCSLMALWKIIGMLSPSSKHASCSCLHCEHGETFPSTPRAGHRECSRLTPPAARKAATSMAGGIYVSPSLLGLTRRFAGAHCRSSGLEKQKKKKRK